MHAAIFVGFLVLLVRKIQLVVIGWHEPFVYPGLAGGAFAALKDGVEVAAAASRWPTRSGGASCGGRRASSRIARRCWSCR